MKRTRCSICDKLFDPRGIKRHTQFCIEKSIDDMAGRTHVEGLRQTFKDVLDPPEPEAPVVIVDVLDTFESVVRELKEANLGFMVITLE